MKWFKKAALEELQADHEALYPNTAGLGIGANDNFLDAIEELARRVLELERVLNEKETA